MVILAFIGICGVIGLLVWLFTGLWIVGAIVAFVIFCFCGEAVADISLAWSLMDEYNDRADYREMMSSLDADMRNSDLIDAIDDLDARGTTNIYNDNRSIHVHSDGASKGFVSKK
jgi:divalent metal cation (Fe/Co/Zn/Cd) transporter